MVIAGDSTATIVLQWANPFGKATDDYNLCARQTNGALIGCSDDVQNGNDDPIEVLDVNCPPPGDTNCLVDVQITLFSGVARQLKGGADPTAYADSVAPWNAPHAVIEMELEPGQFFLTWGGLWHSVGVNESGKLRMAAVARFARTDFCVRDHGYDDSRIQHGKRLPCVVVSGTDTFHLNRTELPPTGDIYVEPLDLPRRLRWLGKNVRDRAADLATQLARARAKYNV